MENNFFNIKQNSLSQLHQRISSLQRANHELQQQIQQKINILCLHIASQPNQQIVDTIKQEQEQMHKQLLSTLMRDQIQIQQQKQMNEIVSNYQKRIVDLRTALVNKEAQIVFQAYQATNQTIPTLQNMRLVHKESFQKRTIKKTLQQLKKIKAQTQALQYYILDKKIGVPKKPRGINDLSTIIQAPQNAQSIRSRLKNTHKDKLLMKVYTLLQVQLEKEKSLQSSLHSLKIQQRQASKIHQHYIQKYQNQLGKKTEVQQNQINFLDELEKAEERPLNNYNLFAIIDANIAPHKEKMGSKRQSKRKSHKINKEN